MTGHDLAQAAEALVGAPFGLHGRNPETGLDCVGLVVAALRACGRSVSEPAGYGLRNRNVAPLLELAGANGLALTSAPIATGDVLLVQPGPAQHHLLIAAPGGRFIHAHAGLRRVVSQPGPLTWPVAHRWRLLTEDT